MIAAINLDRRLCVAPMMAWTDRHCRYLHRLAAPHALLFTEMVTSSALVHGPAERLVAFHASEHPVALQLGGSDPGELAEAAWRGAAAGFDELNLNVGCPSPRVRQGRFGACLMREPGLVAECVTAMQATTALPVTVKCRLGVDDHDSQTLLERFVATVADAGCGTFYVHARKAWLRGLSPAENRTIPPLDYRRVYDLKRRFPQLEIIVNGGIGSPGELDAHLAAVDGVMIGRAAYQQPMSLAEMDARLFAAESVNAVNAHDVMNAYAAYMAEELALGTPLSSMTRHSLGLFAGRPGARRFRRVLSDSRRLKADDLALVDEALAHLAPASRHAA